MSRAPQASTDSRPKGDYSHRLAPRDARQPLTMTVTYRGGPECWWEISARGVKIRRPGSVALHDVLSHLQGRDWS
jgi:hypothetical protein